MNCRLTSAWSRPGYHERLWSRLGLLPRSVAEALCPSRPAAHAVPLCAGDAAREVGMVNQCGGWLGRRGELSGGCLRGQRSKGGAVRRSSHGDKWHWWGRRQRRGGCEGSCSLRAPGRWSARRSRRRVALRASVAMAGATGGGQIGSARQRGGGAVRVARSRGGAAAACGARAGCGPHRSGGRRTTRGWSRPRYRAGLRRWSSLRLGY